MRTWRAAPIITAFAALWLSPSLSQAAESGTPSVVSYGFDGFWTGAQIGLASGYLATGREYESVEWRKLVFGAGVGALVGVGTGLTLGILDLGGDPPAVGGIILRDVGYGVGLGAVVGTAVGALFLIDDGRPKHLLTGAALGSVVGAGAGLVFGLIEGATARKEVAATTASDTPGIDSLHFTLLGSPSSPLPMAALEGSF